MHICKKKRGRPRQNRPEIDLGTKEIQLKRALLVEEGIVKNPALAASLLGIFYGRQFISNAHYEAGICFGELRYRYEFCLGQKFRQYSSTLIYTKIDGYGHFPDLWSDPQHEKRTIAWQKALLALKQAGSEPYRTVINVVFYDPDLYLIPFSKRMMAMAQPLRTGLDSLEAYFKGELQDRRDNRCDLDLSPGKSTTSQPASGECRSDVLP